MRVALAALIITAAMWFARVVVRQVEAHPNKAATGCGGTKTGRITDSDYFDYWYFTGTAGDKVSIGMSRTSGNLDSMIRLYFSKYGNDDFERLITAGSAGGNSGAAISNFILPKTGTYSINTRRINGKNGTTTGTYRLVWTCSSSSGASSSSSACGGTKTGVITDSDYYDYWYFTGTAGDKVSIGMSGTSGNLDSMIRLYYSTPSSDDFEWLKTAGSAGGNRGAAISNFTLPKTGTYSINPRRINGRDGTTTGTYRLAWTCSSSSSGASSSSGCPRRGGGATSWEGKIGAENNNRLTTDRGDLWVFEAAYGDSVEIKLKTPDFKPFLGLYRYTSEWVNIARGARRNYPTPTPDPSGLGITFYVPPTYYIEERLTTADCYYVYVVASSNSEAKTGSYNLDFSKN
ncbi:MAG: PPC domain-containing protein [Chloroflexota bacterium]